MTDAVAPLIIEAVIHQVDPERPTVLELSVQDTPSGLADRLLECGFVPSLPAPRGPRVFPFRDA